MELVTATIAGLLAWHAVCGDMFLFWPCGLGLRQGIQSTVLVLLELGNERHELQFPLHDHTVDSKPHPGISDVTDAVPTLQFSEAFSVTHQWMCTGAACIASLVMS